MEPAFPIEFFVLGTPVSLQTKRPEAKAEWQVRVKAASLTALPEGHFATSSPIAATLYYFPDDEMEGDIDNIVKPVLDALEKHIYLNDRQVHRVVAQKFEPGNIFPFAAPSEILENALIRTKPLLYIRLSVNPFEELA